MKRRFPIITFLVIFGTAVVALFPGLACSLVYDRAAVLSGEYWRLFTGHWVHFSTTHLLYDVLAFGFAGWMIEAQGLRNFGWLCALGPWIINLVLLAYDPELQFCSGLSGLAVAAIAFLALSGLQKPRQWNWICATMLILLVGKISLEKYAGRLLFANTGDLKIVPAFTAHVAGAFFGLSLFIFNSLAEKIFSRSVFHTENVSLTLSRRRHFVRGCFGPGRKGHSPGLSTGRSGFGLRACADAKLGQG